MFLCASFLGAQNNHVTTEKATASGTCAVSHNGNGDVITIQNCGIGKSQADKIVEMLKAVLANQREDTRDAKLDELLELARRAANPYGTITTYEPNGMKRMVTQSTGTTVGDDAPTKDFQAMLDDAKSQDWVEQITLAQAAIDKYPGWFTPFLFLGEAQMHLCMKKEAAESLTRFVNDTEGAVAYEKVHDLGKTFLNQLGTDDYKRYCTTQNGTSK